MKLTESKPRPKESDMPLSAIKIVPEEGGFLEDLDSAVLWAMGNSAENKPVVYGRFASDTFAEAKLTSSEELVKLALAYSLPEWATGFYWTNEASR